MQTRDMKVFNIFSSFLNPSKWDWGCIFYTCNIREGLDETFDGSKHQSLVSNTIYHKAKNTILYVKDIKRINIYGLGNIRGSPL